MQISCVQCHSIFSFKWNLISTKSIFFPDYLIVINSAKELEPEYIIWRTSLKNKCSLLLYIKQKVYNFMKIACFTMFICIVYPWGTLCVKNLHYMCQTRYCLMGIMWRIPYRIPNRIPLYCYLIFQYAHV